MLADAFVVVVDYLFSDPLEPSSRLSPGPALARCSRSECLQNLYSASLQSGYDCFCPVNHEYSERVLVGDEREQWLDVESGIASVETDRDRRRRDQRVRFQLFTGRPVLWIGSGD